MVTVCIGAKYLERWERISLPFWNIYCERNKLTLAALVEPYADPAGKRVDWQKLLCGKAIKDAKLEISNACFVDYDVVPNPFAPDIFKSCSPSLIGFVSQRKNMPYRCVDELLKLIAFYRNRSSQGKYPLDSYLFATPEKTFIDNQLPPYKDYGCGGLFVFNIEKHSTMFETAFHNNGRQALTVSNPGEEVVLNHCIQGSGDCSWIDYSWQTLWWYEMPWNYPWLYDKESRTSMNTRNAIMSTLMRANFLHFVGSWEKWAWEEVTSLQNHASLDKLESFANYKKLISNSPNLGLIFPESIDELKLISK